jgi:DNA-binding transcriptional LysR family regulator
MSDLLSSLRLFVRIAHTGSFSRAGRELGLSQPSVSRIAAALEQEVGVSLLTRTTRAVTLTEAGVDYLAHIEPILAALEEANYAARGSGELRGTLRIALSSSFAIREVIPRLSAFLDHHPELRIDLLMNDQRQDLVVEGADVALRFGALSDSNATARKLGATARVLVASPKYLIKAGTPKTPAALANHSVIVGPAGVAPSGWSFQKDGRTMSIHIEGRLTASMNEGAIASAVAGLGIAATGLWGCRKELASGELVLVLADWKMTPVEVHAIFPAGRAAKPSARAFVDHMISSLAV